MKHVNSFREFTGGLQESGEDMKPKESMGALSEKMCEALKNCYEAMAAEAAKCSEMMANEAKAYHEDENPEHTAESWAAECSSYMKECNESKLNEIVGTIVKGIEGAAKAGQNRMETHYHGH